ncbi:hypothetical protein SIPHO039v1_p0177 [Vibrio phage 70E35.5a]|nr:hypothetical protein SIPHO035v1_p0164 [Vibrio phage 234P7B]QZI88621.1 hypothetical protein SIPHO037v1_p0180 [Vibrio phage 70E35.2]QZI88806.1 hypothetical protein SIPHO039v1_p0177 [Vibrio phage 70E35.5a]
MGMNLSPRPQGHVRIQRYVVYRRLTVFSSFATVAGGIEEMGIKYWPEKMGDKSRKLGINA